MSTVYGTLGSCFSLTGIILDSFTKKKAKLIDEGGDIFVFIAIVSLFVSRRFSCFAPRYCAKRISTHFHKTQCREATENKVDAEDEGNEGAREKQ